MKFYVFFPVYVFIGVHMALVDLVRALAEKRAFDNGEYIVISVDDNLSLDKFFQNGELYIFFGAVVFLINVCSLRGIEPHTIFAERMNFL